MMLKFACSCLCFLLLVAACASDPAGPRDVAQDRPTTEPSATPSTSAPTAGPTALVVPTIVATDNGSDGQASPSATSEPQQQSPDSTPTPEATATPRPTSTPRPIPTAVVAPTPRPVVPTATAVPRLPRATAVPPTPTPTPTTAWINPDCYVGPGAADEPVWWCGGRICVVGAPHQGCPPTPPPQTGIVEVSCTVSKSRIQVDEIITLQAFQDPVNVPITFAFGHGDGTIDETSTSYAYYEAPGSYDVIMYWRQGQARGSLLCGTVTVVRNGPAPTPTTAPTVQIGCTISPSRTVAVGELLTFTAFQDPSDVPIAYVFDHGDGTLDPTAQSSAFYAAPGSYEVRLRWAHSGTNGTILCGTVTVESAFNASNYVGQTTANAEVIAASRGLASRVVRIDGEWLIVTQDYRLDRVNFEIVGGVVTRATIG